MILSSLIAQLVSASFLLSLARGFVLPVSTSSLVLPITLLLAEATSISTPARATTATSTSISTSTSYTPTPLYLHVTPSPPDILGISNISGVYGPGAWAAWFLTGVAAWYRIFTRSEEKIDVNTWVSWINFLFLEFRMALVSLLLLLRRLSPSAHPRLSRLA
jgi:hypothetical protein